MNTIILDGESLTLEQVLAVANGQPGAPEVGLSKAAQAKVEQAAQAVARLLAQGEVVYGVTTGFGAFKDRLIKQDEVEPLQRNIIFSHAVGVGEPFDGPTTRAIMLVRANTLARGHSGVRRDLIEALLRLLEFGAARIASRHLNLRGLVPQAVFVVFLTAANALGIGLLNSFFTSRGGIDLVMLRNLFPHAFVNALFAPLFSRLVEHVATSMGDDEGGRRLLRLATRGRTT